MNKIKTRRVDGRLFRWFDCDWNNDDASNSCERCRVCKYLNFLDFAHSVGKPYNSVITYDSKIDGYFELKTLKEKKLWLISNHY